MTAYSDFMNSITSAHSLTEMYKELRRSRGLGQRGRLTAENEDLLWLPRSAIVISISALDAYVHAVLYERIPNVISSGNLPDPLAKALAATMTVKDGKSFRNALPIITSSAPQAELTARLRTNTLEFLSYQSPEKIQAGYELIGHDQIFGSVAALWPGRNSSEDDLKRILANYVKRRNQIAHEGDREASGAVRHIQPQYADKVARFVQGLVNRLNRVVYPNEAIGDA